MIPRSSPRYKVHEGIRADVTSAIVANPTVVATIVRHDIWLYPVPVLAVVLAPFTSYRLDYVIDWDTTLVSDTPRWQISEDLTGYVAYSAITARLQYSETSWEDQTIRDLGTFQLAADAAATGTTYRALFTVIASNNGGTPVTVTLSATGTDSTFTLQLYEAAHVSVLRLAATAMPS